LRLYFIFILIFFWVNACGPTKKNQKRYTNPDHSVGYKKKSSKKTLKTKKKGIPKLSNPPLSLMHNLLLPTIVNEKDQTLMILINKGNHHAQMKKITSNKIHKVDETKAQRNALSTFYIDRTEITVSNYKKFQPRYNEQPFTNGKPCPQCPAMGINWNKARNYCKWAGKRLPNETEWETAARGDSKFTWPWGNEYLPQHANLFGKEDGYSGVATVGSFSKGASPDGVVDMVGNVWEWINTNKGPKILKGGGWTSYKNQSKISFRNKVSTEMGNPTFGFRCAR